MDEHERRTPSRPFLKLGLIAKLGERLSSDERPPYELTDHDEELSFDDPTGDQLVARDRTPDAAKGGKSKT